MAMSSSRGGASKGTEELMGNVPYRKKMGKWFRVEELHDVKAARHCDCWVVQRSRTAEELVVTSFYLLQVLATFAT